MKKKILAAALALCLAPAAFAQSDAPAQQPPNPAACRQAFRQQRTQRRAGRLARKLGLDDAAAQRFTQAFETFASQRKALRQQVRSARKTLRAASKGDSAAAAQVDAAIAQLQSVQAQRAQLRQSLFQQLSNGLTPQQKAKLTLKLSRAGRRGHFHRGHRGMHRWGRQNAQRQ